jgi:hypothetical protein
MMAAIKIVMFLTVLLQRVSQGGGGETDGETLTEVYRSHEFWSTPQATQSTRTTAVFVKRAS